MTPPAPPMPPDPFALFAAAPTPMLVVAPDAPRFTIVAVNQAYLAATLRRREDLLGSALFEAMPANPDDPEADGVDNLRASIGRAIRGRRTDRMAVQKYDIPHPDGGFEPRWWDPVNTPVLDAQGRVSAVIHQVTDATRRVGAETALQRSETALLRLNEELEQRVAERTAALLQAEAALRQSQKMEAVGQLTGGLAHDFNNLLAGISGALELMQSRLRQGRIGEVGKYMVAAQGAARRAAMLTHRLLAFSRQQTTAPRATDVDGLVGGMLDLIRRTAGPGVEVTYAGAPGLWRALVDPSQLENALLNLCINARDAMPEGGRIAIEAANHRVEGPAAAAAGALPEGQYLSLCVSDTGTGMTPEVMARAFDPFFTTKPQGQGTGLGLSMIHGFAEQSGGRATIRSEAGQGAVVCLHLPRHRGPAEAEARVPQEAVLPPARPGETVLVVDDEPTVRMLVADLLEDLGYTAVKATNGAAGLQVLRSDIRLDLLVTNIGLPGGMNGRRMVELARQARPDLKVLFITGFAESTLLGRGQLEPGMSVLTKPFPVAALAHRMRELINRPA